MKVEKKAVYLIELSYLEAKLVRACLQEKVNMVPTFPLPEKETDSLKELVEALDV